MMGLEGLSGGERQRETLKAWKSNRHRKYKSVSLDVRLSGCGRCIFLEFGALGAFIHCKELNGRQSF